MAAPCGLPVYGGKYSTFAALLYSAVAVVRPKAVQKALKWPKKGQNNKLK